MILYAKEGIYARRATEGAQDNVQQRAKNAVERAKAVMEADKPEPKTVSAYDEYKALQLCKPIEAGIYWRANKQAIYACINR
jgi:hypothetical protein